MPKPLSRLNNNNNYNFWSLWDFLERCHCQKYISFLKVKYPKCLPLPPATVDVSAIENLDMLTNDITDVQVPFMLKCLKLK